MRKLVKLLFIAFFLLAVILAGDNSQLVSLRFLDRELVTFPFALWLILCFGCGVLLALLFLTPVLGVQKARIRRLQRKLRGLPTSDSSRE